MRADSKVGSATAAVAAEGVALALALTSPAGLTGADADAEPAVAAFEAAVADVVGVVPAEIVFAAEFGEAAAAPPCLFGAVRALDSRVGAASAAGRVEGVGDAPAWAPVRALACAVFAAKSLRSVTFTWPGAADPAAFRACAASIALALTFAVPALIPVLIPGLV